MQSIVIVISAFCLIFNFESFSGELIDLINKNIVSYKRNLFLKQICMRLLHEHCIFAAFSNSNKNYHLHRYYVIESTVLFH